MTTPQDKKRLSYAKDRRNTYRGNNKASRKLIPRAKARANRSERHSKDRLLSTAVVSMEQDELSMVELKVKTTKPRHWRKSPDEPLGKVLAERALRRKSSA